MPKLTKYEKSILEPLLHEAVSLRDKEVCRRCGGQDRLQASHIYPKGTHQKMRYILDNVLLLCWHCHFKFWHLHPLAAKEWYDQAVDKDTRERLKLQASYTDKSPQDYKLIRLFLEAKIKEFSQRS